VSAPERIVDSGHLVISPHPDDAVWSLGGRLAGWSASGLQYTVVTVFDGPCAVARETADPWRQVADPIVRRAENRSALSELGAGHVSLNFTDAALRASGGSFRYSRPQRLFGPWHPDDRHLMTEVREALRPLCAAARTVHAPLAAGHHVDHRLTRAAVETLTPANTIWYEDFPYRLRSRDHAGLRPRVESVERAEMDRWLVAAAHYTSQVRALFENVGNLRKELLARACEHAGATGLKYADRHWVPGPTPEEGELRHVPSTAT
jgi:LmbE family N-acetylglucosaminyl deacetylase